MNIIHIGSEATPYSKTGGLADVLGSLPKALTKDHNIHLIIPFHKKTKDQFYNETVLNQKGTIRLGYDDYYYGVHTQTMNNFTVYFIDNNDLFGQREQLYGEPDDSKRYAFFNHVAVRIINAIKNVDVVHCHDWQSGLVPYILRTMHPHLSQIKTVFTIHNIAYQGIFPMDEIYQLSVPFSSLMEFNGQINLLKTAIVSVDSITTVSSQYAKELTDPYFAFGMEQLLKQREDDFIGIVNGLNYDDWSSSKDPNIVQNYNQKNFVSGKKANKKELLKLFALKDQKRPLIVMITRLTEAKGLSLVTPIIRNVIDSLGFNFILLGSGDVYLENQFNDLHQALPDHIGVHIGYNESLARQLYAGADFFLMPSRFEPCGLAQLISYAYGTIPIVHDTGGLHDTVIDIKQKNATGFVFHSYQAHDLYESLIKAQELYKDTKHFREIIKYDMGLDFSWNKSAEKYTELYKKIGGNS
jgi:starch synthase